MADNFSTDGSGNVLSTNFASREVTYSGDTGRHIAPAGLVTFAGSDDAKTATDVTTSNPLPVREPRPATATRTTVTITSNNTVAASNTGRLGLVITNPIGNARALLKYGATATTSDYDVIIDHGVTWFEPTGYTGRMDGIIESGSGSVRVVEITA